MLFHRKMSRKSTSYKKSPIMSLLIVIVFVIAGITGHNASTPSKNENSQKNEKSYSEQYKTPEKSSKSTDTKNTGKYTTGSSSAKSVSKLANMAYHGKGIIVLNSDKPSFSKKTTKTYIKLSKLDRLGRCQTAEMCASASTMPKKKRGDISAVKPAGWHQAKIKQNGKTYLLYNRSHLLAWSISGLLDDPANLSTGTQMTNQQLMTQIEREISGYIEHSKYHIMYRVTPVYRNNELVPRGFKMEAQSVETNDVSICRYVFNIQPGVSIDYKTGYAKSSSPSVSVKTIN